MDSNFYIIPRTSTTFDMRWLMELQHARREYSAKYCLVETESGAFAARIEEERELKESLETTTHEVLKETYPFIEKETLERIKTFLEAGAIGRDDAFEAIFRREADTLLKRAKGINCTIKLNEEDAKKTLLAWEREVEFARRTVISKACELIEGSKNIEEDRKEEFKEDTQRHIEWLEIELNLTGSGEPEMESYTKGDYVAVSHGEREIRELNGGEVDGLWESKNFLARNLAILIHEIGHQVGSPLGYTFGESFAVKMQEECLKDIGVNVNVEKVYAEIREKGAEEEAAKAEEEMRRLASGTDMNEYGEYMDWNEDGDAYLESAFERSVFGLGIYGRSYDELRHHFYKVQESRKEDEKLSYLKINSRRDNTHENLKEYGEVYLDRGLSLQEMFDSNAERYRGNHTELSVHDTLMLERFFSDDGYKEEKRIETITNFLFDARVSRSFVSKFKRNLVSNFGIAREKYEAIEKQTLISLCESEIRRFASKINPNDAISTRRAFNSEGYKAARAIAFASNFIGKSETEGLMADYYEAIADPIADHVVRESNFLGYSQYSDEIGDAFVDVIEEKEAILAEEAERLKKNTVLARSMRTKKITISGKTNEEIFLIYNETIGRFETFDGRNGAPMQFRVHIEPKVLAAMASAEQNGTLQKHEFAASITFPTEKETMLNVKKIEERKPKEAKKKSGFEKEMRTPPRNLKR